MSNSLKMIKIRGSSLLLFIGMLLACIWFILINHSHIVYAAQPDIKVNAGGTAVDGLSADQAYTTGSWGYVGGSSFSIANTITNNYGYPSALQTCRYINTGSFNYKFDVENGTYTVKLYFAEPVYNAANQRKFNLSLNGTSMFANLDVWSDSGGFAKGLEKVYTGIVVTGGQIDLQFTGVLDAAMVSAIVVHQTSAAAQPDIKVNAGGTAVDGLSADQAYTTGSWGYVGGSSFSIANTIMNDYGYPSALQTCRYINTGSFNYKFDVANGIYTVKLYFAEPAKTAANQRKFNLSLNGTSMFTNLDVWSDSGGFAKGLEKVYTGIVVTGGQIDMQFTGVLDAAMVSAIVVHQTSAAAQPDIKVNAGGAAADGLSADQAYTTGSWGYVGGSSFTIANTITNNYGYPSALQRCRYINTGSFNYKFDVANGIYTVKLYFAEPVYNAANQRKFNLSLNGTSMFANLDVWSDSGGFAKGLEKVYTGIVVTGGQIDMQFTGVLDAAMVSAIVVHQTSTATPNPFWNLNTANTSLMLTVSGNNPAISLLENNVRDWNWTPAVTEIPLTNRVDIGATQYSPNWVYQDAALDTTTGKKVTLRFTSSTPNLELKSIWWARPGSGPVEHWMTIENKTGSVITVYQQESLQMDVKGDVNPTLWRFHKESGTPDGTGTYKDNLTNGNDIVAFTNTDDNWNSNGYIPLIFLDSAASHGLYVGWEWPHGRIRTTTSSSGSPSVITVKAGLNTDFKTDIGVSGFYDIPSVYIGAYSGTTDDGSNILKKWFLANKAPSKVRTDTNEPYSQTPEQLMGLNYDLASWGVNSIEWDYGWWPGTGGFPNRAGEGDWRLGNTDYINAISYLGVTTWSDYGLYNQSKNLSSNVYFLLHDGLSSDPNALSSTGPNAHPDWFTNRMLTAGNSADLGNDSAVTWIKQHLLSVMNANHIDTYRSDIEPIAISSGQVNNHKYSTDIQYWNAKGFYKILDYLYTNKTGFRYENNASGGALKDYATMSRSTVVAFSDSADADAQRKTFYTTSYAIPSAQLLSVTNLDSFTNNVDDDYGWRSIIMSGMMVGGSAVGGHLPNNGDTYMEEYFKMFRDKIRPMVRNANLYHILPRPDGSHWDGVQYFDPAKTGSGTIKGAAFIFKPSNTEGNTKTIYLKGLDPNGYYTLDFEDRSGQDITTPTLGSTLMAGINVSITETKSSEIIWIK